MKFLLLLDKLHQSTTVFYRQIPCTLFKESCVYKDLREIEKVLFQVKALALDFTNSLW